MKSIYFINLIWNFSFCDDFMAVFVTTSLIFDELQRYAMLVILSLTGFALSILTVKNRNLSLGKKRDFRPLNNPTHSTIQYKHERGAYDKIPDFFFVRALLLIVHTWNFNPLRINLLRLQCTCCTVPTTSGSAHGSPLVWACQWPSSQPLSSPHLSHNDTLWA